MDDRTKLQLFKAAFVFNQVAWFTFTNVILKEYRVVTDKNKQLHELSTILIRHADVQAPEIQSFLVRHEFDQIVDSLKTE
jgi:hypothetical protein